MISVAGLYRQNKIFFFGFLLFIVAAIFVLFFYTKAAGFFLLNPYHSSFADTIFIYFTYLGDGFFCVAVGLLLYIFKKKYAGLMVLSSYAISGIIAQVLKYFIIEPRPAVLLKDSSYKYFIDGVTLHNFHAFPSGHTASAFALAAVLSFTANNKNYAILFLLAAMLVGYSRIFLAQHFLDDVLAGAIIGVVSAIFCQLFFDKIFTRLSRPKKNKL